jgi:hypothetical protein
MNNKMWAAGLFAGWLASTIDVFFTSINITIFNPIFGGNVSDMEKRISGGICFVGGLILWYLPKQPKE